MRGKVLGSFGAAIVIALAAGGCGGDDDSADDGASTESSITKEDFVAEANEICANGNDEIDAAAEQVFADGKPSKAEAESFVTDSLIPSISDQVEGLREIGAPAGDEDQVNAILDAADQALSAAEADPAALTSDKADPFAETNELANEYGLTECGG